MKKLLFLLLLIPVLIQAQNTPQSYWKAGKDTVTVGTRVDTLSRLLGATGTNTLAKYFNTYYQGYIATDDTIEVSTTYNFTSTTTAEIQSGEVFGIKFTKVTDTPDLYIRAKGTGRARIRWTIGGN